MRPVFVIIPALAWLLVSLNNEEFDILDQRLARIATIAGDVFLLTAAKERGFLGCIRART
jgi:hypothetical protein